MSYPDLRAFLDALDAAGRLRRIAEPVDKDRELNPLVKWQYRGIEEDERFGFLFERVVDAAGRTFDGCVASSVLAPNRQVYALALGLPESAVHERWRAALRRPVPVADAQTAPVCEEVHIGAELLTHGGLDEFPIPFATNGWEAFPRITAAAVVTRDPETGVLNAGMYNSIVLGPARANIRTSRHLHAHWRQARSRGVPLEAALVIGAVPAVTLAAATDVPAGMSELEVAGGLAGEPIRVVRCATVDLEVPATAEVVIEGRIPPDRIDVDGPSGENRGHVMPGGPVHPFEVTGIMHRRQPIWHDIICQYPPSESSVMRSVNCEGRVHALLEAHGLRSVRQVAFHHCGSARHLCALRMAEPPTGGVVRPETVWHALHTVLSVDPSWPKIIVAVDADIDPCNLDAVLWAVCNRCQPHRDLQVVTGRSGGLDESVGPRTAAGPRPEQASGAAAGLLVNAARKWANPPLSLPRREYMEGARRRWESLGLPALRPREPWYGISLGFWPERERELVRLSESGRRDEAAALVLAESRDLPPDQAE